MIALVLLEQVRASMQAELVKNTLSPIGEKLETLLAKQNTYKADWGNRLKIATQWQRSLEPIFFMNITEAQLSRKQLQLRYWKWSTCEISQLLDRGQKLQANIEQLNHSNNVWKRMRVAVVVSH
jgi:hypothetical protein